MAVRLIGSERINASLWNTLFQELDARLSAALGARTFMLLGIPQNVAGRVFWFNGGDGLRPRSDSIRIPGVEQDNYDHTPFRDAAEDEELEVALFDESKKIITFTEPIPSEYRDQIVIPSGAPFFDASLEAHRRLFDPHPDDEQSEHDLFWVMEPGEFRAERICSYGLVELVFEFSGSHHFRFRSEWNKYRFFRIHNLGTGMLTLIFEDGAGAIMHSIEIPSLSCKCVRRETSTSGYLDGFTYFNQFKAGDPTVYEMPLNPSTPAGTMGANTVICPALVYRFLPAILSGVGETMDVPTARFDPHELYDVEALYREFYG